MNLIEEYSEELRLANGKVPIADGVEAPALSIAKALEWAPSTRKVAKLERVVRDLERGLRGMDPDAVEERSSQEATLEEMREEYFRAVLDGLRVYFDLAGVLADVSDLTWPQAVSAFDLLYTLNDPTQASALYHLQRARRIEREAILKAAEAIRTNSNGQ